MKAIVINRRIGEALTLLPNMDLIPDSAMVQNNRPVFLPDFHDEWDVQLYVAVRMSRLGKNIGAKFAHRYYDAVSLAMRLIPVGLADKLQNDGRSTDIANVFDGALTIGEWSDLTAIIDDSLEVKIAEQVVTLTEVQKLVDETISAISKYATLKIGDVIMPLCVNVIKNVKAGTSVAVNINNNLCLSARIK